MANFNVPYEIERDGQIEFFDNYGIPYSEDDSILVDNTDGVYNGNILEFKLTINNLNKTLLQAIKYLSRMRIKGKSVPATILLIDLNATTVYVYKSKDYFDDIHKVYIGAASKDNEGFVAGEYNYMLNYSETEDSATVKKILKGRKVNTDEMYMPINIDENCIVGWAERYYSENPKAKKGDFLGDKEGTAVKVVGEIRNPRHFKGLINAYTGESNEKFKYLMDCLNDKLSKKDLGAFYTPVAYAKKAAELVQMAVDCVPEGNDYIILDRCAGTGNLEAALIGLTDRNGDELIEHCVVSTYEYYEYKVLMELFGDKVRDIIPPTEGNVVYDNGIILNADAMSKEYIENPIIKQYVDSPNCTIILFENPPYDDTSAINQAYDEEGKKHTTANKASFVFTEMSKKRNCFNNTNISTVRDFANRFIWSGFEYYLRNSGDSFVLFSPVKYFKSLGIINHSEYRFIKGFLFNRKHFHATPSSVGCILWSFDENNTFDGFNLEINDIENDELKTLGIIEIKPVNTTLSSSNSRYIGQNETNIACDSRGEQVTGKKLETKIYVDDDVIGYFCPVSASYDMGRLPYFNGRGNYILKTNYMDICVLFSAKMYPFDKWYEKGSVFITFDGGYKFKKDKSFIKSCLIYTCLSNKNKCLSFDGLDGHFYRNELSFDKSNGETVATDGLSNMDLDAYEEELIKLWNNIIVESKKTINYNCKFTYGTYQIENELNTYQVVKTGKTEKTIYDYPSLNGYLDSLRSMLKTYYKSHIVEKLFEYELLK